MRWQHDAVESVRVDQWLWSIRVYKTRTAATEGCAAGHVRLNGSKAKPAAKVRTGDRVEARVHQRDRVFEVVKVIDKRVGAALVAECVEDLSPPAEERNAAPIVRAPGSGRPTRRDRRQMERFRG